MKEKQPNLYEGMYVIRPTLSEEARKQALSKVTEGITSRGGEIVKMHEMGRRKLAYEIDKNREGYYYLIYFNANPSVIGELWKDYHLHEDLLRFMTLRADEVMESLEFKTLVKQ